MKKVNKNNLSIDEQIDYGFLDIVGLFDYKVCIPDAIPEDLKQKIIAASKSAALGIKSVDYVLKKFGPWDISESKNKLSPLDKILIELISILNDFSKHLIATRHVSLDKEEGLGFTAASVSLQRCRATFDSVLILLKKGFGIEARVLGRTIVEQIGWSLSVSKLKTLAQIHNVQSQKTIGNLKKEYALAGIIYGDLSNYSHLSSKLRGEYYLFYKNKANIIFRNQHSSFRFALLLILILDCYIVIFEKLCLEHEPRNTSWKLENGVWKLNMQRPAYQLWLKYKKKFLRLSKQNDQLKLKRYLKERNWDTAH